MVMTVWRILVRMDLLVLQGIWVELNSDRILFDYLLNLGGIHLHIVR